MKRAPTTIKLAMTPIFAALVCVVTLVFVLNIPQTNGYFNIGETVIYTAALLFGPFVGGFAGGFGAAIADILVAPVFAPGTFVIKLAEGAIVGFLYKRLRQNSGFRWRICAMLLGAVVGILLAATGSAYYQKLSLYVGYPPPENPIEIVIPAEFWYILGIAVTASTILVGAKVETDIGQAVFSIIAGGLVMIVGYFLYEQVILGQTMATVEVAANIGQMLIGLIVAVPVTKALLRWLPQLKNQK